MLQNFPLVASKIDEFSVFLSRSSAQEVQHAFVHMIDNIFGLSGNQDGWYLHKLTEADDPNLFVQTRKFLSPSGRLLDYITHRLMVEALSQKFSFPISLLSIQSINTMYGSTNSPTADGTISLNAFEYFMFSFFAYIHHSKRTQCLQVREFENSVYATLFMDYLAFYLFLDSSAFNMVTSRLQYARTAPHTSICQRNYFNRHIDSIDPTHQVCDHHILWPTEAFLQAVTEFLLSWRSSDHGYGTSNNPGRIMETGKQTNHFELSFVPSACHLYLVRVFLKYFYYTAFHHVSSETVQTPYQQLLYSKVASYHKYLRASICFPSEDGPNQMPLLVQLKDLVVFCIQHWPMDLSFEIAVETWLTSIQPWRYVQTPQPSGSTTSPISSASKSPRENFQYESDADIWTAFATKQYSLYLVPFLLCLRRATRMDLRVSRNAHMIIRVAKVFSQPGLQLILQKAEGAVLRLALSCTSTVYPNDLIVSEQSGLWGPVFLDAMDRLDDAIQISLDAFRQMEKSSSSKEPASFPHKIWLLLADIFCDDRSNERLDRLKCERYLTNSLSMLRKFFSAIESASPTPVASPSFNGRLDLDDKTESPLVSILRTTGERAVEQTPRRVQFASDSTTASNEQSVPIQSYTQSFLSERSKSRMPIQRNTAHPDSEMTIHGREALTPLGRFQILMGQRRPNIKCTGDNDYLPPRTYEIAMLVELFRCLSELINSKMRSQFRDWCSRPGIKGWTARQLLLPVSASEQTVDGSPSPSASVQEPRISLRWLASYAVIFRILLLYLLFVILFRVRSPLSFTLLLSITFVSYQLIRLVCLLGKDLYTGSVM